MRLLWSRKSARPGFSLAEVLLAMVLAVVALLALIGQNALLLRSSQKQENRAVSTGLAQSLLDRFSAQVARDQPPGFTDTAYNHSSVTTPFRDGTQTIGETVYNWEVMLSDVTDINTGQVLGTGPTGAEQTVKLKEMSVTVSWWNQSENTRQGIGKVETKYSRLLRVKTNAP